MNDKINLIGSVVVLSHNRPVCKTSCTYSKIDVRDTSVIPLIARLGHSKRQLYGKGRESNVLDVNVGYIYCTNNQYNMFYVFRVNI